MPDFLFTLFILIILASAIYLMVRNTYTTFRDLFHYSTGYRFKHLWHQKFSRKKIKPAYRDILASSFVYYQHLSPENKQVFERRVQTFIDMKTFIVRSESLSLTAEMKVLIAACAIQLTFGLPGIYFRHFHRILVYPDDYYSTITNKYHQGEVNRAGVIVLSWKNFLSGYANERDGRNLGLHEMAHALLLEDTIVNGEFEFLDGQHLEAWNELAHRELQQIQEGNTFFRAYGATNIHEFFAVAVEVYFERPRELVNYDPSIYESLKNLLNQDILALRNERISV
jgi:Mlc titration factor MtfA (ptsG expression regulator)